MCPVTTGLVVDAWSLVTYDKAWPHTQSLRVMAVHPPSWSRTTWLPGYGGK